MRSFLVLAIISLLGTNLVKCENQVAGRIINGQDADYKDYVTMVSGYNGDYGTFGGGSFISERHVVTAASLIYNMTWWFVDYGSDTLGGLPYDSATALMHPDYNPVTFEHNIGILFVDNPVDLTLITPVPLPTVSNTPLVNEQGRVAGFGMFQSGTDWILNQKKQVGYFRRIPTTECVELLSNNGVPVPATSFCAMDLDYGANICYGDLGSGMTLYIDEINTLVGIVSVFTNMCHYDYPTVYTQVAPYVDWINEHISG